MVHPTGRLEHGFLIRLQTRPILGGTKASMKMKSPRHSIAVACAFAVSVCGARAAGVAALKEQTFHRDSSARTVAYSRIIDSRGPYLRIVSAGRNIEILRSNLIARIELPDGIPRSIMEEDDIAPLRELLNDVGNFTARYPRSIPVLRQQYGALASHVRRFDAGDVRFEGAWISKKELVAVQETRRRENEAGESTEVEKRVFESAQRDKGMVLHDGRWMTRQAIGQLPPESTTELSEAIEPLWNGDLQAARFAVKNLMDLTARQTGAPKVRTERLMHVVRNLFLAEARLTHRTIARASDTLEAAKHDQNAQKWLVPNAFGTVSENAARESREKAREIRQHSADLLAQSKQELIDQFREADVVMADFHKLRELRVVLILAEAVRAVSSRHFTAAELRSSFPGEPLASIRGRVIRDWDSSPAP